MKYQRFIYLEALAVLGLLFFYKKLENKAPYALSVPVAKSVKIDVILQTHYEDVMDNKFPESAVRFVYENLQTVAIDSEAEQVPPAFCGATFLPTPIR